MKKVLQILVIIITSLVINRVNAQQLITDGNFTNYFTSWGYSGDWYNFPVVIQPCNSATRYAMTSYVSSYGDSTGLSAHLYQNVNLPANVSSLQLTICLKWISNWVTPPDYLTISFGGYGNVVYTFNPPTIA